MPMGKTKYVTLYYMPCDAQFVPSRWTSEKWPSEIYTQVLQMPRLEFTGETVIELAEELIRMTSSSEWVHKCRRAVRQGDLFCVNRTPFMFSIMQHEQLFKDAGMKLRQLRMWSNVGVVELPKQE